MRLRISSRRGSSAGAASRSLSRPCLGRHCCCCSLARRHVHAVAGRGPSGAHASTTAATGRRSRCFLVFRAAARRDSLPMLLPPCSRSGQIPGCVIRPEAAAATSGPAARTSATRAILPAAFVITRPLGPSARLRLLHSLLHATNLTTAPSRAATQPRHRALRSVVPAHQPAAAAALRQLVRLQLLVLSPQRGGRGGRRGGGGEGLLRSSTHRVGAKSELGRYNHTLANEAWRRKDRPDAVALLCESARA